MSDYLRKTGETTGDIGASAEKRSAWKDLKKSGGEIGYEHPNDLRAYLCVPKILLACTLLPCGLLIRY